MRQPSHSSRFSAIRIGQKKSAFVPQMGDIVGASACCSVRARSWGLNESRACLHGGNMKLFMNRMRFRRAIAASLAAAGIAAAGLVGVAQPAQAASSDCGSGYACAWSGYDYGNDGWIDWKIWRYCIRYFGASFNDQASSFYNNGNSQVAYLYPDLNGGGIPISRPIKSGYPNLGTVNFNDKASSGYFDAYKNYGAADFCT